MSDLPNRRSREQLAAHFGRMYAGWDRGVNMEGPSTDFRETPMTAMESEARYVAAEIGLNIHSLACCAALAPIITYDVIRRFLGPVFDAQQAEIERLRTALHEIAAGTVDDPQRYAQGILLAGATAEAGEAFLVAMAHERR